MFYFYFYCFVNIDKKRFREGIFRFSWCRQINSRCHTHVGTLLSGGGDLWTATLREMVSMEAGFLFSWNSHAVQVAVAEVMLIISPTTVSV